MEDIMNKEAHNKIQGHEHTHEAKEKGLMNQIQHFFKPHSHDAADSIDNALEGSKEGIKAVKISLLILGATVALQLIIVIFSGSIALFADTIHNFADASTAIPLWLAFSLGRKTANKQYTYGFGRAEDVAGIFVIFMIAGSSVLVFWEAFQRLLHPQTITNLGLVAIAAVIGFLGNEAVAQYRIKTGNRMGSAALVADGYHARTDGFTSLAVLLGVIGVWLGFVQADSIVGMGITIAIAFVLKDATIQVWHRLMDAVDPKLVHLLEHAAEDTEGVKAVSAIKLRWIGHNLYAEAEITADCELSLEDAHTISEKAHHAMLHAVPKLAGVSVHVEPCTHNEKKLHGEIAHHYQQ